MTLKDLSADSIRLLTRILQLLPDDDPQTYSNRTLHLLQSLPSELRRPNALSRFISTSTRDAHALCALHKPLNSSVVHELHTLIALEVGVRLNSLIANNQLLSDSQWALLERLRDLHHLWLSRETFQKTFLRDCDDRRWKFQEDGCQACTLARIGGQFETLLDLRVVLLSRTTKRFVRRYGIPRLTPWLESWIALSAPKAMEDGDNLSKVRYDSQLQRTAEEAKSYKFVRKQIIRAKRNAQVTGTVSQPPDIVLDSHPAPQQCRDQETLTQHTRDRQTKAAQDNEIHFDVNAESEDIDHYAALLSTPHLPSTPGISINFEPAADHYRPPFAPNFHFTPAKQSRSPSIAISPRTAPKTWTESFQATKLGISQTYTESMYSVNTLGERTQSVSVERPSAHRTRLESITEAHTVDMFVEDPTRQFAVHDMPGRAAMATTQQTFSSAAVGSSSYSNLLSPFLGLYGHSGTQEARGHGRKGSWQTASIAPSSANASHIDISAESFPRNDFTTGRLSRSRSDSSSSSRSSSHSFPFSLNAETGHHKQGTEQTSGTSEMGLADDGTLQPDAKFNEAHRKGSRNTSTTNMTRWSDIYREMMPQPPGQPDCDHNVDYDWYAGRKGKHRS